MKLSLEVNPFSSGGGGVSFEQRVAAYFLTHLLCGDIPPGLDVPASQIRFQARQAGAILDDILIIARDGDTETRLHVQVKHVLRFTAGDPEFYKVVNAAMADFHGTSGSLFRREIDRLAIVIGSRAGERYDNLRNLLEIVRTSLNSREFFDKVADGSFANRALRQQLADLRSITSQFTDISDAELFSFLRHLFLIHLDLEHVAARDGRLVLNRVRDFCPNGDVSAARGVLNSLLAVAVAEIPSAATHDRQSVLARILLDQPGLRRAFEQHPSAMCVRVSPMRLPSTRGRLVGRAEHLRLLDDAWADTRSSLVCIVAPGGVGKTALVKHWLASLAPGYYGAQNVFTWSFYSQGVRTTGHISAEPFMIAALAFFGDPSPTEGTPEDRGRRLAELMSANRSIVVIDGVEPLQCPPGPERGVIKDPGLQAMLTHLASLPNSGLCVVTTREPLVDLESWVGSTVSEVILGTLSPEEGAVLLENLGVVGSPEELRATSQDFGGHGLALLLLGNLLREAYEGDIQRAKEIPVVTGLVDPGAHAIRVMQSYENWLLRWERTAELALVRLLGFFDRPATRSELSEILRGSVIPGVTEFIRSITTLQLQVTIAHLREMGLLYLADDDDALDAHPIVREYFAEQLRTNNLVGWREGHTRLFRYMSRIVPEKPRTVDDNLQLYAAMIHGCAAGLHHEALERVLVKRLLRGVEFHSSLKMGLITADIQALSGFFVDGDWSKPVSSLSDPERMAVGVYAGTLLMAVGRYRDAVAPMEDALNTAVSLRTRRSLNLFANLRLQFFVTYASGALSHLFQCVGELGRSLAEAERCVSLSGTARGPVGLLWKMCSLSKRGDVLLQMGEIQRAEADFATAERLRQAWARHPALHSLLGYWYCDFLLHKERANEVEALVERTLELAHEEQVIIHIALEYLSLGRALAMKAQHNPLQVGSARSALDEAVLRLERAKIRAFLIQGLLARAEFLIDSRSFVEALKDLERATDLSSRSRLRLFETDCCLLHGKLGLARAEVGLTWRPDEVQGYLHRARKLIEATGYFRREGVLEGLCISFDRRAAGG